MQQSEILDYCKYTQSAITKPIISVASKQNIQVTKLKNYCVIYIFLTQLF